jgi:hypothetical protein
MADYLDAGKPQPNQPLAPGTVTASMPQRSGAPQFALPVPSQAASESVPGIGGDRQRDQ